MGYATVFITMGGGEGMLKIRDIYPLFSTIQPHLFLFCFQSVFSAANREFMKFLISNRPGFM